MLTISRPIVCVIALIAVAATVQLDIHAADSDHDVSPTPQEQPDWLSTSEQLEEMLTAFDVPGLAFAALVDCSATPVITVGAATLDPTTQVSDSTVFEAASLSKPIFAYLVMQLVDEGLIDLDRPLARDFAYARIDNAQNYAQITSRMILAHQTGLPNWVGDTDAPDRSDPIAFVAPPGTQFSYSGEAYELLRSYVEFRTSRSLAELFRERLGHIMPDSTFAFPLPAGTTPSRGYTSTREPTGERNLSNLGGAAGGLLTTAADYARFLELICSGQGLSESAHRTMLSPQSPVPPGQFPAPTSWALGWAVMGSGSATTILHGGDNGKYRSIAAIFPNERGGMVVLTNGRNGGDLIEALIAALE